MSTTEYWQQFLNFIFPYLVGFAVAVFGGHVATKSIVDKMWEYIKRQGPDSWKLKRYMGQGELVGIIERSLIFGALLVNESIFVGVWLTLKTISQSPRWGRDTGKIPGRAVFQPFIVGTGFSLLFSAGGYALTSLLLDEKQSPYLIWGLCLGLLSIWGFSYFIAELAVNSGRKR